MPPYPTWIYPSYIVRLKAFTATPDSLKHLEFQKENSLNRNMQRISKYFFNQRQITYPRGSCNSEDDQMLSFQQQENSPKSLGETSTRKTSLEKEGEIPPKVKTGLPNNLQFHPT